MAEDMQRIGGLREIFLSFENLYAAYKKAYKGTKNKQSYEFFFHMDRELWKLHDELESGRYCPGDYRYFTINDPKKRIISVAPFRDRVVHHALINILEPIYEKRFIYDSYATRKNKGTHKAIHRAQCFLRKTKWFLKMDIKHFFPSIDHAILLSIIERKIKDRFILDLCNRIIDKGGDGVKGLPIGNLTSQFFANVYLDIFDHHVKDELALKYYLRYMDDFCLFGNSKTGILEYRNTFTNFLEQKLNLKVKENATMINTSIHGLSFLGVRIFPNLIRLKNENFQRSFSKLKNREDEYRKKKIDYMTYECSMQSVLTHLQRYGKRLLASRLYSGTVSKAAPTA